MLLWNNTATDTSTSVSLTGLPYTSSNFSVTRTLVDSTDGNYYNDYASGDNADTPSPNENAPVVSDTVQAASSSYSSTIDLPAYSVTELILTPTTAATGTVTTTAAPLQDDLAYGAAVTDSSTYTGSGWAAANLTDGQDHSFEAVNVGGPCRGLDLGGAFDRRGHRVGAGGPGFGEDRRHRGAVAAGLPVRQRRRASRRRSRSPARPMTAPGRRCTPHPTTTAAPPSTARRPSR